MNPPIEQLNAEALYSELLSQIKAAYTGKDNPRIIGIHSGGVWVAERLAKDLGIAETGVIDVSFYRDDYAKKGLPDDVIPTKIPFEVEGAEILLVDDVLYTGRTTRAAINELFDYGRPARVKLATLVDRGSRELPIAADFKAASVTLSAGETLVLSLNTDQSFFFTVEHA